MDKPEQVISEKSVGALLDNAKLARLSKLILGWDGQISAKLSKKMIGGQWIMGKAYLTPVAFEFRPDPLNKFFVTNIDALSVRLLWPDITNVNKRFGMVGPIVDFETKDETCSIRCQGADRWMAQIDSIRRGDLK